MTVGRDPHSGRIRPAQWGGGGRGGWVSRRELLSPARVWRVPEARQFYGSRCTPPHRTAGSRAMPTAGKQRYRSLVLCKVDQKLSMVPERRPHLPSVFLTLRKVRSDWHLWAACCAARHRHFNHSTQASPLVLTSPIPFTVIALTASVLAACLQPPRPRILHPRRRNFGLRTVGTSLLPLRSLSSIFSRGHHPPSSIQSIPTTSLPLSCRATPSSSMFTLCRHHSPPCHDHLPPGHCLHRIRFTSLSFCPTSPHGRRCASPFSVLHGGPML